MRDSDKEYKLSDKIPDKLFKQLDKSALKIGKSYDIVLDHSHQSIENVERMLSDIHNEYSKSKDDTGLHGIALGFAAYIVRTIQQNTGIGIWYRNDSQFGKDTFPFEWKDAKILYPLSWCEKRLFDGEVDNIWNKYQALVLSELT